MEHRVALLEKLSHVYDFSDGQGFLQTNLEGVRFFRATEAVRRSPLLYEAGIVIIGQGYKVGYLDGDSFRYDADHYLILSVPIPFECETVAKPDEPMLGLFIDIDLPTLQELVVQLGEHLPDDYFADDISLTRGLEPVAMESSMENAALRLLRALCSPMETDILGPSAVREIMYHALLGQHGRALYQLTQYHSQYARISRALAKVHEAYAQPLQIEDLAKEAAMSQSVFYRIFKQVTGDSPLQYLKKVRLNKAKSLLLHGGERVGSAAYLVGYESPSQFSREFKRYFQMSPVDIRQRSI